jgi:hypothetical protein
LERINIIFGGAAPGAAATAYGNNIHTNYNWSLYQNFEKNSSLLFHEMAHPRQYCSGELSVGKYIAWSVAAAVDKLMVGGQTSIHDRIPVERKANAYMTRMEAAYNEEGRPCD